MDIWTHILERGGNIDNIYLDFAKAFYSVPQERLKIKLEGYGIRGNVLAWIEDFLHDRKQCVVINGTKSSSVPVTSGVPQGSVLGSLLFLCFINDMPDVVHSSIHMFGDDAKLFREIKNQADCEELQKDPCEL